MNTQHQNIEEGTKMTDAMETVSRKTANNGLSAQSIKSIRKELDYLNKKLNTDDIETIIFCSILNCGSDTSVDANELARELNLSNIKFIGMSRYLDALVRKRLLRTSRTGGECSAWRIPFPVIKAITEGRSPDCEDITGLNNRQLFRQFYEVFKNMHNKDLTPDNALIELQEIVSHNLDSNDFVRRLEATRLDQIKDPTEQLVFYYMLHRAEAFDEFIFCQEEFDNFLCEGCGMEEMQFTGMHEDNCTLFDKNIIEYQCDNGQVDEDMVVLTDYVKDVLLKGIIHRKSKEEMMEDMTPDKEIIKSADIKANDLFYNPEEARQIAALEQLMDQDNYVKVQERLQKKGMANGFTVLFYGAPGTGKTASVFELARKSGRDVYFVDQSKLRSKWNGESEKALKGLFERYKEMVENSDLCPILVLNECDSLMYKRLEDADTSSEQLNNAMVNILLNELDNFKGILIATSNLAGGLDDAFERRILYKVEFNKPEKSIRQRIWCSKVEELSKDDVYELAARYAFTGAQIDNVARKANVNYVLTGKEPDLASLRELCDNEHIKKQQSRQKIGF